MDYPGYLNPFLVGDDEDDTASFFSAASPPNFPPPPPPSAVQQFNMSHLKLPVFSADAPMAWFAVVEAQFKLQRIWSEEERSATSPPLSTRCR